MSQAFRISPVKTKAYCARFTDSPDFYAGGPELIRGLGCASRDQALFRSHVEYALPSTSIYTPPDKIWESMLDTLADSAGKR